MQLCLDRAVSVRPNDGRREVGVAVCRNNEPEVHEPAEDEFIVLEAVQNIFERDFPLTRGLTLVILETGFDKCCFCWSKPFRFLGEVGDDEVEGEGHDAGEEAFENEDPSRNVRTLWWEKRGSDSPPSSIA